MTHTTPIWLVALSAEQNQKNVSVHCTQSALQLQGNQKFLLNTLPLQITSNFTPLSYFPGIISNLYCCHCCHFPCVCWHSEMFIFGLYYPKSLPSTVLLSLRLSCPEGRESWRFCFHLDFLFVFHLDFFIENQIWNL